MARQRRPERLARFSTFVNAPGTPDPTVVFIRERGQVRPARPDEKGRTERVLEAVTA